MAEYKTSKQVNYGFGLSFEATGKAPVVAKRIWSTLEEAQAYVDSTTDTAIAGLQLTVINDTDTSKNGVYFVKEAAGDGGKTKGVLVKLAQGGDTSSLQTQITANKSAIDKLNGTTDATSVSKKISDAIAALDVSNNVSDDSYGINVMVNETNGKVDKPIVAVSPVKVEDTDTAANGFPTGKAVKQAIDAAVSGVRVFKGCYASIDALNTAVPVANRRVGDVYNITEAFTLDSKNYPAGTDVAWVGAHTDGSTSHPAHWDALGGVIDFSSLSDTQSGSGNFVKAVTQKDGKVTVTKGTPAVSDVTGLQTALDGKVPNTREVNGKVLTEDITLTGADIKVSAATGAKTITEAINSAAASGVTSFGGKTGTVTVDSGKTTLGDVNFTMSDNKLTGKVVGIKSAAGKEASEFATAAQGAKADKAVLLSNSSNGDINNSGSIKLVQDPENNSTSSIFSTTDAGYTSSLFPHKLIIGDYSNEGGAVLVRSNDTKDKPIFRAETTNGDLTSILVSDIPIYPESTVNKKYVELAITVKSVAGSDYVSATTTDKKTTISVTTKNISTATERDNGLATASDVKSYVDGSVRDALTWAEFA